jgi:HlyD family secretion protein
MNTKYYPSGSSIRSSGAMILAVLALGGCARGQTEDEGPSIQASEVARSDLLITVEATGQVEPIRNVEVKSKASGEILRLHVDVGDRVAQGDLLAEVDPRDVRNSYDQAQADLEVARARLEIAESQLRRSEELLAAEVITEQEHEGRNLEFANARAQLVKAETNLELAELRLMDVTIRAPMAGTILTKNVEEGAVIQSASGNVSGGTTLFLMANLDEMQVRTLVDETDMGQIRAESSAKVSVEAFPGREFQGVVEKIEPQAVVQQNVTMFPVIVRLDNRTGLLRPGMNAEVEVMVAERRQTLVVPNNAIVKVQEMAPAAMVLGMDPEGFEFDRSQYAALYAQVGQGAPAAGPEQGQGGSPAIDSIRARIQSGEITRDSARVLIAALRGAEGQAQPAAGAPQAAPGAQAPAQAGMRPGGFQGMGQAGGQQRTGPQPAVAFVMKADGTVEPRAILTGVNDWDNTEVLAGLEEGEQVALIGAAQLQAQQQEWINRIREMRGGGVPGMSGGPGRR